MGNFRRSRESRPEMFEAVIFDWDGTLADTRDAIVLSFQKVLREVGCEVSDESLEKQIGIGARNMFKNALKAANIPFDEEAIDKLLERKIRIHAELTQEIRLFDGAEDLLGSLRSNVKIALATMSNRKVIDKILSEKGIRDHFDVVITADEVDQPKPNPEIFLKSAIKLKSPPEKCVVVEDSVFGVIAAKNANMKCIAIPSGSYSKVDLAKEEPSLIIDSINEKEKILEYVLAGCSRT
ncbi:MAG: HAD family phosphatase [Candidatus Bathyarchaeota archaeon]|nr:HAD family phosphatase [Candidatus Bathyarchaeota archaeon]